jgi:hypothetical protein
MYLAIRDLNASREESDDEKEVRRKSGRPKKWPKRF